MGTFSQLVVKVEGLKQKLRVLEHVKDFVDDLEQFDREALDEVLLDLDEFCVAPLTERIDKIEKAKITKPRKTTEKKDVQAKAKKGRKSTKESAKGKAR